MTYETLTHANTYLVELWSTNRTYFWHIQSTFCDARTLETKGWCPLQII